MEEINKKEAWLGPFKKSISFNKNRLYFWHTMICDLLNCTRKTYVQAVLKFAIYATAETHRDTNYCSLSLIIPLSIKLSKIYRWNLKSISDGISFLPSIKSKRIRNSATKFDKISPLWQNFKIFGLFWGILKYLAKCWTFFCKFYIGLLGKFSTL